MSDIARLRAHAQAIAKQPPAATWNFYTRERVVQRAREMLALLDGAVLLSREQAKKAGIDEGLLGEMRTYAEEEIPDALGPSFGRDVVRLIDALLASGRPGEEQA